jgi:oxygen-independent coproporphyrinogen-3 oxidase
MSKFLAKYNVPVPRYTSYPPANYFKETFTAEDYRIALEASNRSQPEHVSFYIHIPFCRHLCHYCGCNSVAMKDKKTVERYVSALRHEISGVLRYINPNRKIAQIHYGGGTPTILPVSVLKEFNDRLLTSFPQIDRPEIAVECHPSYLSENEWLSLADAGFNRFSIGVQDFKEAVLKAVNRRKSRLPLGTIFRLLRERPVGINLDLLYGLPFQSVDSFSETVMQAAALEPDRIVTFSYAHVPWINPRQLVLEKTGFPAEGEKALIYDRIGEILGRAGYETVGFDHFVRRTDELYFAMQNRQLHRNFQGYTTRRTTGQVYAFGSSAVSQLTGAYAQNSKEIGDYIRRIETDGLATVRGYALSAEEQITREVITTLMCNLVVDFERLSEKLHLPVGAIKSVVSFEEDGFRQFVDDGIVRLTGDRVEVTSAGRLYVRNVAAVFDRMHSTSDKKFSRPV